MSWPARFYDGKSAARHEAQIEIESDQLSLILNGDTHLDWPFANLHWAEKPGSGAIQLGLTTARDARLTIEDQNFTAALRKAFPGIDRMTARHLGHRRSILVIISSSIALAGMIYAAAILLPRLITPLIPESIQQSIGDSALSDIISLFGKVEKSKGEFCSGAAGIAALDRLVDRLAKSENGTSFRVRVADLKMVNALAVPGGRVLATRGIIDFVKSPEEFAGVIAHEMGHAIHRHPTKSVIRGIGLGATLDFLLGGGLASTTTSLLLHTSYSRDAEREADFKRSMYTEWSLYLSDLLGVAHRGYRFAGEREKPDLERDRGYQDRDVERTQQKWTQMEDSLWLPADRLLLELILGRHQELPPEQQAAALTGWIADHGGLEAALEELYNEPALATTEGRLALLDMDVAAFEASDDPWITLAIALESYLEGKRKRSKEISGAKLRLMPLYMDALKASRDTVYPDANNTLRVTVGNVKGYSPKDAVWYQPHTTVAGMVAKAGDDPYDAPERFVAAAPNTKDSVFYDADLGDVPVNFLSTLDTTGGNSGSATLNAKGEFVGFLFDGNYEAMSADWLFDPELTRSIHVDVRYALWLLEVEGAEHILTELGVR